MPRPWISGISHGLHGSENQGFIGVIRVIRGSLKFARVTRSLNGGYLEHEIGVDELKAALDAGRPVFLLDVREPWEYQLARIEGSKLVPMNTLPARLDELDRDAH